MSHFNPVHFIQEKRDGKEHSKESLTHFIQGVSQESIPSYQTSAWLMAAWIRGLSHQETSDLTMAMLHSGDIIDLSHISGIKVDKHSTGGVGDTTSLILAPIVAALGAPIAKMSGRGLGHTGGTLDKLSSIPGMNSELTQEEFVQQVQEIGISIISQSANLVPADGIFYALRDVTATINAIPLIASSIMSKKLACGADAILLDVKYGDGAFMPDLESAEELAQTMVEIGKILNKQVCAALSTMDAPLGNYIGNSLEVLEAIEILRGEKQDSPLAQTSFQLAAKLLEMAGQAQSFQEGLQQVERSINEGLALAKMKEFIEAQGGEGEVVHQTNLLPQSSHTHTLLAEKEGYISQLTASQIGMSALHLGAGRLRKEDEIDLSAGLILHQRPGDRVEKGSPLVTFHYDGSKEKLEKALELYQKALKIDNQAPEIPAFIKKFL